MFGFFKKSILVESTTHVFNLKPLYNSLSSSQKTHFDMLADMLYSDIHQFASTSGFSGFERCSVGQKKDGGPEFIFPTPTQMYMFDNDFARFQLHSFYPFSKFDSVVALRNILDETLCEHSVLSVISGEAAVRLLRGDFFTK